MESLPAIERFVSDKIGRPWKAVQPPTDSSGRRKAQIIRGSSGFSLFVKFTTGSAALQKAKCEERALEMFAGTPGVRTPVVIGVVEFDESNAGLILQTIDPVAPDNSAWTQLGKMLASLHEKRAAHFGLTYDNYIGDFPQQNSENANWNEFYATNRVLPMLKRAVDQEQLISEEALQIERVLENIDSIADAEPRVSLLHGDFWRGNVIFDENGPLLIDPAISFGNREMDIAFSLMRPEMEMDSGFYRSYCEEAPLPDGADFRRPLWQLWPLLTHVVQDGRKWVPQLLSAVALYP